MPWISHISRSAADGKLRCNTQDLDGSTQVLPVHQVPHTLTHFLYRANCVEVDSAHHDVGDVSEYLDEMGWSSLPAHGQTLHKFYTPKGELWVPSQLLVQSLFAVVDPLARSVFTPRPVSTFCRPVLDLPGNQIAIPSLRPSFSAIYTRLENIKQRLSWLAHSKSARRAWGSVYRNALDGFLDCIMPEGVFQFCFRGIRKRSVFCATSANLHTVTCSDIFTRQCSEPQSFALGKHVDCHPNGKTPPWNKTVRPGARSSIKCFEMSDSKFDSIKSLLQQRKMLGNRGTNPRHLQVLRSHLNLIHTRDVHGCAWVDICAEANEIINARERFKSLLNRHQWSDVQALLQQEEPVTKTEDIDR